MVVGSTEGVTVASENIYRGIMMAGNRQEPLGRK